MTRTRSTQLDREIAEAVSRRERLAKADPRRGFYRQVRFEIYSSSGKLLGDVFAFDRQDALDVAHRLGYRDVGNARDIGWRALDFYKGIGASKTSKTRSHAEKLGHRWADRPHTGRRKPSAEERGGRGPGRWRGTEVQTLLFERPRWTPSAAKAWARDHDYLSGKVHVTDNYVRLRQFDPVPGTQKRTIVFGEGIKAVIEQVK